MADTWDNIHSGVLLIGMFLVVHYSPTDPIIHLIPWMTSWTFGYYLFATKVVPPQYRPPNARGTSRYRR